MLQNYMFWRKPDTSCFRINPASLCLVPDSRFSDGHHKRERLIADNHYNGQNVFESTLNLVRFDGMPRIVRFTPHGGQGPFYVRIDPQTTLESFKTLLRGGDNTGLKQRFANEPVVPAQFESSSIGEIRKLGAHLLEGKREPYSGPSMEVGGDYLHNKRVYWLERAYTTAIDQRSALIKLLTGRSKPVKPPENATDEELELFNRLGKLRIQTSETPALQKQWVSDYMAYVWKRVSEYLLSQ